ncbi:hypothetical protein BU23DRAFT_599770 [Bimuria novae-zelandiae CBS 107.79]|uniref:Uncharacterized protein n=1 Tax=Bimuria novae-zelandiae CBS 107.79 TaxID=1447943 RepID=A0A6A5V7P3_9PLEO|nr:hypothetical protein BU23DRAFT_599770 [Bimuria novae-zelandiae CBS 107.79]
MAGEVPEDMLMQPVCLTRHRHTVSVRHDFIVRSPSTPEVSYERPHDSHCASCRSKSARALLLDEVTPGSGCSWNAFDNRKYPEPSHEAMFSSLSLSGSLEAGMLSALVRRCRLRCRPGGPATVTADGSYMLHSAAAGLVVSGSEHIPLEAQAPHAVLLLAVGAASCGGGNRGAPRAGAARRERNCKHELQDVFGKSATSIAAWKWWRRRVDGGEWVGGAQERGVWCCKIRTPPTMGLEEARASNQLHNILQSSSARAPIAILHPKGISEPQDRSATEMPATTFKPKHHAHRVLLRLSNAPKSATPPDKSLLRQHDPVPNAPIRSLFDRIIEFTYVST